MNSQLCKSCLHEHDRCFAAPNSTCSAYVQAKDYEITFTVKQCFKLAATEDMNREETIREIINKTKGCFTITDEMVKKATVKEVANER